MIRLLPLLAATVALSAGLACPTAPFNDFHGNVVQDCVNGNHHLSCADEAKVTILEEGSARLYDDIVFIDGDWFGLTCSGAAAVLESNPTVSCPELVCDHVCSFTNAGGVGPKSECKEGYLLKSCTEGNLHVGSDEFTFASCISAGRWVAWDCDGRVKQIDGSLQASCSPLQTSCPPLRYLTQADVPATSVGVNVDTEQKAVVVDGVNQFKCAPGSQFGMIRPVGLWASQDQWLTCTGDEWIIENTDGGVYRNELVGCIRPTCTGLQLFDGSESLLATSPQVALAPRQLRFYDDRFELECPSNYGASGYGICIAESPTILTCIEGPIRFTCESDGWWIKNPTTGTGAVVPSAKIGCFQQVQPTTCPALRYLTQADVPASFVGVTVDTTQKAVLVDGVYQLKCAPGSEFAYVSVNLGFRLIDWWLTCSSAAGNGWRTNDASGWNDALGDPPVGCVKTEATTTPPPPPTTTAPTAPTGPLVQFNTSDHRCAREAKCHFRVYSSQKTMFADFCDTDTLGLNIAVDIRCNSGDTKLEGVSQPAGSSQFKCSVGSGNTAKWFAYNAAGGFVKQMTTLVNPIVTCGGA